MKRLMILCSIILLVGLFNGCKNPIDGRSEIDKIMFVTVFGIDSIASDNDSVKITLTSPMVTQAQEEGSQGNTDFHVITSQGKSVFEAIRNTLFFTDKRVFLGHVGYIIIGEDAAKKDIANLLDFFTRDHEIRLNSEVLVVKGQTAEELIKSMRGDKELLFEQLENIQANIAGVSKSGRVELIELMKSIDNVWSVHYIPYITCDMNTSYPELRSEGKNIYLEGYGIFKDARLYGYIMNDLARGLNWTINEVESGYIHTKTEEGSNITMEIINSHAEILPYLDNEDLSVTIKVRMTTNIVEIDSGEDVFNEKKLTFLENQQSQIVRSEINSIIDYAQTAKADIFDVGNAIHHKYPIKWKSIEGEWEQLFPSIPFNIIVESSISRTYNITKPSKYRRR
ncbi:Ger(x)C family spore germination protein [Alkaliphilus pronyensis]|uniref:Ger(X)C family spore germination protein n=1 Tax=Alkaliphilus pronyensis TaxID=1482732 RepID=A0A6I0EWX8_9FIRM|nr:Ger(x)C family spore germination protein [Alkaliphilus pronyensis]KAB3530769.1 Ger(x)C family spore germination protein [Alkaliphilus pronyensis]